MKLPIWHSNSDIMPLLPDTWHKISKPILNSTEEIG
jgi:hypothetical protein